MRRFDDPPSEGVGESWSDSVTVLVQGPTVPLGATYETIQSVRRVLPGSRIILSTWRATKKYPDPDLDGKLALLAPDEVVLSTPVDAPIFDPHGGTRSNLARMLISTSAGLAQVETPYVLKIRTDTPVTGRRYLEAVARFANRDPDSAVFAEKVVVPSIYTRQVFPPSIAGQRAPRWPAVLHVSDWAAFGRTTDVARLYGAPLPDPSYYAHMSDVWPKLRGKVPYRHHSNTRFPPEMWLGLHAVGYPLGIRPEHFLDADVTTHRRALTALVSNFVVLSAEEFGITSLKYWGKVHRPWFERDTALTNMTTRDYAEQYDREFGTRTRRDQPRELLIRLRRRLTPVLDVLPRWIRTFGVRALGGRAGLSLEALWRESKV